MDYRINYNSLFIHYIQINWILFTLIRKGRGKGKGKNGKKKRKVKKKKKQEKWKENKREDFKVVPWQDMYWIKLFLDDTKKLKKKS